MLTIGIGAAYESRRCKFVANFHGHGVVTLRMRSSLISKRSLQLIISKRRAVFFFDDLFPILTSAMVTK